METAIKLSLALAQVLIPVGIFYGMTKATLASFDRRMSKVEEIMENLKDVYVSQREFDRTVDRLERTLDEIQSDIKNILQMLKRP